MTARGTKIYDEENQFMEIIVPRVYMALCLMFVKADRKPGYVIRGDMMWMDTGLFLRSVLFVLF